MKAFISSKSPVKHAAVEAVFAKIGTPVETVAEPTESDVSEQPLSFKEARKGAENRHAKLVEAIGDRASGNYLITIESGIFKPFPDRGYYGTEVVIVERDGRQRMGLDVDIEFPEEMTNRIPHEYADLGELVMAEYGAETKDPYPFFTNGLMTRQGLIEHTLAKALMQMDQGGVRHE